VSTPATRAVPPEPFRIPEEEVRRLQRTRRHPRPTQHDYLHARYLVEALERTLPNLPPPVNDVLDVYCGTRPYDDLLPAGSRRVGMDLTDFAGVADVVSDEFLPFEDESFDVVMCTEAFYYVRDPREAAREIARVLRPGGSVVITVSLPWEYDRETVEHRYTGPELEQLFDDFEDVRVVENGGYSVSWATLTGRIVFGVEQRLGRVARALLRPLFVAAYLAINAVGEGLDRVERRTPPGSYVLPMNLMLTARRPTA
jgi:SAM-dependent methyltransferase